MQDRFENNVETLLNLYGINSKFGNFKFFSSAGSYTYYEFSIFGNFESKHFDIVNKEIKGVEFISRDTSTYIKVLNVPQVNQMAAFEALLKFSQFVH